MDFTDEEKTLLLKSLKLFKQELIVYKKQIKVGETKLSVKLEDIESTLETRIQETVDLIKKIENA